ncbi:MAG: polyprenyl diphosphate synthase [Candidatus Micrarchaeia archaeon]
MAKKVPSVLALIPDGNRRWALKHRLSFYQAYSQGVKKFIDFAEWCKDYGVKSVIVWAFSTENFKRPSIERNTLFSIYENAAKDKSIIERLHKNRTRLKIVGNMALLPKRLQTALHNVEEETKAYKDRVIYLLIAYGGRNDLVHAAKELALNADDEAIKKLDESKFKSMLFSSEVPDPDLVIRTSGERRLSGILPWQVCYSELYFSKKLWPDFTRKDLRQALLDYGKRQRRFGQ